MVKKSFKNVIKKSLELNKYQHYHIYILLFRFLKRKPKARDI